MITTEQTVAEDFNSTEQVLKKHYDALRLQDRENFRQVVLGAACQIVDGIPDAEFQGALALGDANSLFERMRQPLIDYCSRLEPAKLRGFPVSMVELSLRYHLAFAFESAARSRDGDQWRMPFGNMITSAIYNREAQIKSTARINAFLERLGPAADPDAPAPPRLPDPTVELRERADLNPATKVNVLKNYMDQANREGLLTHYDTKHCHFLTYHRNSLEAARRFFQVNPRLTVQDLIEFIDSARDALTYPLPPEGEDEAIAMLQKCRDLSYLLITMRHLRTHHEWLFDIPLDRYLTKSELFGRTFDPAAIPGADDPHRPPLFRS